MADDLSAGYLAHRTSFAERSAGEELLAQFGAGKPKPAGEPAAPATSPVQGEPPGPGGNLAVRAAKDVAKGVTVDLPRAIGAGIRDAYQSTLDLAKDVGDWVEQKADLPVLMIDKEGVRFTTNEEAAGRRLSDLATLPEIDAPESVTGGVIKGIAQFLTGMKGAGKLLDVAGVPKMAGAAGYSRAAAQGAIANFAAFDPHQQRLSNLIERFPALSNPVTEYLASSPDDSNAEGRFKNALEGVGLGVLTDGFLKGVSVLRNVRHAKALAADAPVPATEPQIDPDAFRLLGDDAATPTSSLVRRKPFVAPEAKTADFASPTDVAKAAKDGAEDGKLFINFARIDTADDVKRVMREMADRRVEAIDAGRRGKQTFAEIKLNAEQVKAWDMLNARRVGEPLNAEQSVAARQLWASSSEKLAEVAQLAAQSPNESNLFAFRKMLAVHDAVQQQVIAARTETARALASWRIPAGGGQERLRDVAAVLEQHGGTEVTRELAQRVSALSRAGMHTELASVVEKGAYAKTRDAVIEAWINGLLSNPVTHVANTVSNFSVSFVRMGERLVAEKIRGALGDDGGVAAGEAAAQWYGMVSGLKDAFRYSWKALKTGDSGYGMNKLETAREGALSSEALSISESGWLGRSVDLLGQVVRVPGRALAAEDEFFKTIGYRMELHAQALRQAADDVAAGRVAGDGLKMRIAELLDSPPENLRLAAIDAATYQTFTNAPGKIAQSLSRVTSQFPGLKVIMPFVRTPANILTFTFERTPLAPLMSRFRGNIAAGGARQQLALAQMGLGSAAMFTFADLAMNGQITGRGPSEAGERQALLRSGWKPYSVNVDGQWYTYNRLDPVGSLIGMSADVVGLLQESQHTDGDDETDSMVAATAMAFAGNLMNKTYLSGLSSIVEALNDPTRFAQGWSQRLAGSIVPSGVAAVTRLEDPYVRQVYTMMDAIRARTPGLSDGLPKRLDLWGRPLKYESGMGKPFDALSPVMTSTAKPEPIDEELLRHEINLTPPGKRAAFNGATVDLSQYPKAYERYVELSGNQAKHPAWGVGAKDYLNAVVSGKHPMSTVYGLRSDGPDGGKEVFIRDAIRQYRDIAKRQLLDEFPELRQAVGMKQEKQRALKLPKMAG
jgi:hypothetical protein